MAEIKPFRGFLYDPSKVSLPDVVAPPYDVITPEQQAAFYEASPYNIVRLILGREEDRYSSAARYFVQWQREQVLVRDTDPALYVLHQTFEDLSGRLVTRKGFIALCRLEEFNRRIILPHEQTLAKPREDRLKLLRATNANFSQVFSLYSDPQNDIDQLLNGIVQTPPAIDLLFEDVRNKLWRLQDEETIRSVQAFFDGKQVFIADGHHRYETALAYREERRAQNPNHTGNELYNYVMMYFTNIDGEGVVMFPTHRLVHSLPQFDREVFLRAMEEFFIIRQFWDYETLAEGMKSSSTHAFGLALQGDPMVYLATLKPARSVHDLITDDVPSVVKELDVTLLHALVFNKLLGISAEAQEQKTHLEYLRDAREAIERVRQGKAQAALLMNPTPIAHVRAVAKAGCIMPQKSTYFYPKLVSGLVLNVLAE